MIDLSAEGRRAFILVVVFLVFATVSVALRLYTRVIIKAGFGLDDFWIVFAMLVFWVYIGLDIWSLSFGSIGEDSISNITPATYPILQRYLKALFLLSPFYDSTIAFVRWSIHALYRRIFTTPKFRRATYFLDIYNLLWYITNIFGGIFSCSPVDYFWNPAEPGSCMSGYNTFVLVTNIFGIVLDIVTLMFPVRMISRLQMSRQLKFGISAIFLLGSFVVITGIVRVHAIYSPSGEYVNFLESQMWSSIHPSVAFFCACAPTYKPLWPRVTTFLNSLKSFSASLIRSSHGRHSSENLSSKDDLHYSKAVPGDFTGRPDDTRYLRTVEVDAASQGSDSDEMYPMDSVRVKNTLHVV